MTSGAIAKCRMLVVDDDRGFRHAIGTLLQEAGHLVVQAADGRAALDALGGETFDVMLLDVGLPDMSGLDVLAAVQNLAAPPRVVMITGDDTPETLLKAIRGQADRYITKPFAPGAILEVVDEVLEAPPAAALPITVVSARPEWVELVAPCSLHVADRVHGFMMRLPADLPEAVRESVGHGVSRAALERRRVGRQAGSDADGAHLLPARAPDAAVPHRRSGPGIQHRAALRTRRSTIRRTIRSGTPSCEKRRGCGRAVWGSRSRAGSSTS